MADRTCAIEGCEKPPRGGWGWCKTHYARWRRRGTLELPPEKARPLCAVDGCERVVKTRGWCSMHYDRWRVHGDPATTIHRRIDGTPEQRFWSNANQSDGCWLWLGSINEHGYGVIWLGTRRTRAHRFGYELIIGPVSEGLDLDHLCRVRSCVNPAHLEPVTRQVNLLRGETIAAAAAQRTHCPAGHEYTPENTRINRGSRICRECARIRDRARNRIRRRKAA